MQTAARPPLHKKDRMQTQWFACGFFFGIKSPALCWPLKKECAGIATKRLFHYKSFIIIIGMLIIKYDRDSMGWQ